jgi:hypothetical protein
MVVGKKFKMGIIQKITKTRDKGAKVKKNKNKNIGLKLCKFSTVGIEYQTLTCCRRRLPTALIYSNYPPPPQGWRGGGEYCSFLVNFITKGRQKQERLAEVVCCNKH